MLRVANEDIKRLLECIRTQRALGGKSSDVFSKLKT